MKTISAFCIGSALLLVVFLLFLAASVAAAADHCPPPPPVCDAPDAASAPASSGRYIGIPAGKKIVEKEKVVTVKKQVWDEETYTAQEVRTEILQEVKFRTAYKKTPVRMGVTRHDVQIAKVKTNGGRTTRLARPVQPKLVAVTRHVSEPYQQEYTVPFKHTTTVPVERTRKVSREVEEQKTVTEAWLVNADEAE